MPRRPWSEWLAGAAPLAIAALAVACSSSGSSPTAPPASPPAAGSVSGVVTEAAGENRMPLEGAVVTHFVTGRSTITDANGSYTMAGLPPGTSAIVAGKDGYEAASAMVNVSAGTRLDLQLVRRRPAPVHDASVSGIVFEQVGPARVPLAGVVVENSYTHSITITDSLGQYRLEFSAAVLGNTDGFARIHASKEGYVPSVREIVVDGDTRLDVELVRR